MGFSSQYDQEVQITYLVGIVAPNLRCCKAS
jgi:hypothetical protein